MKTRHPESAMQQALVARCWRHPVARDIYAIPNGGSRRPVEASIMRAEGVRAGMPDLHLPVRSGACLSLYIELKCARNKPSDQQRERIDALVALGHRVAIIWDDWMTAWQYIERYLEGGMAPGWEEVRPNTEVQRRPSAGAQSSPVTER